MASRRRRTPLAPSACIAVALLAFARPCLGQAPSDPIDLSGATVVATHNAAEGQSPAAGIIDGDPQTLWAGDGHDLTALPTNLVITLPAPIPVGGIELTTEVLKDCLRLTSLEVYAQAPEGWALLGSLRDNRAARFTVPLRPSRVGTLRLRVLDTARPDHAWPRILDVRLFPPAPGAELEPLQAAPVPAEPKAEGHFLRAALGIAPPIELEAFDPRKGYVHYARSCVDSLLAKGTDVYGPVASPMLVSILSCPAGEHPGCELPPIKGQRQGDRAHMGGNLQHDVMLLQACHALSGLTGEDRYRQAADDYLRFFLDNCTGTATGLWPWGEHAHWDFYREAPGHTTHEYLGAPPLDFWERAWEMNPQAVLGEADGLINHVVNLATFDYNRHADISRPLPDPRPEGLTFLDFPRHGGFYIQLWALPTPGPAMRSTCNGARP